MAKETEHSFKNDITLIQKEAEPIALLEKIIKETDSESLRAEALFEYGLIKNFKKDYSNAIRLIEDAIVIFKKLNDHSQEANCQIELAWLYYRTNKDNFLRALTLLNDIKTGEKYNLSPELRGKLEHYYGLIEYREGHYGEAMRHIRQALICTQSNSLEAAKVRDSVGVHYARINEYTTAINYLEESLRIKESIGHYREQSLTKHILGRVWYRIRGFDNAIDYFESSLGTLKKLGDSERSVRILIDLARSHLAKGNLEEADKYASKAISIGNKLPNPIPFGFAVLSKAMVYQLKGDYTTGLELLKSEVYPIFKRFNIKHGFALYKRTESILYVGLKEFDNAIEALYDSLTTYKKINDLFEIAITYIELSRVYLMVDNKKLALATAKESFKIAEENNFRNLVQAIEDHISDIDEDFWVKIVDKRARKEKIFESAKSVDEALLALKDKVINENEKALLSLVKIGQAMTAERDLDKLLNLVSDETRLALDADRCSIFILDQGKHYLWSKIATGIGNTDVIKFPAHKGIAGHVAMTGEIINIKDAYKNKKFNIDIDQQTGYRTKSILCIPIRNLNKDIIGVFQVLNKLDGTYFTEMDEDLLIAISGSASIALENANLFAKQEIIIAEKKKSFNSFINTLAHTIDKRDSFTGGHSQRVTEYSLSLGRHIGLSTNELEVIEYAALLHDFGKICIKDSVLTKEGALTVEEYKHIQEHAYLSYDILKNIYFEDRLKLVPEIAAAHHEKYDGTGYFRRLSGNEIPLGGRILAVADVFDALTSKRHYRDRMPMPRALTILQKESGSQFDPAIMKYFFELRFDYIMKILLLKDDYVLTKQEVELFSSCTVGSFNYLLNKEPHLRTKEENIIIGNFNDLYNRKFLQENP